MEPATGKVRRAPSNLFLRISELCKVHSVGVMPAGGEKPKADSTGESSEDGTNPKVHPHQVVGYTGLSDSSSNCCEEAVVVKLINAISELKLAYVKLQQAHVPYDPEKIKVADERVASELEELAGLEDLYANANKWSNPMYQCYVSSKIQEHQKFAVELQATICKKDSEIVQLRSEMDSLERNNMELTEKIGRKVSHRVGGFMVGRGVSIYKFLEVFELTSKSMHDFTKCIVGWMKVSGWNPDCAISLIDNAVVYKKRAHKKYAIEAYFTCIMFRGAQEDYLSVDCFNHIMSFRDPFDALMEDPDSNFGRFCRAKYLVAVPWSMEDSFFGNLDHRGFVKSGGHPRTPFYQAFVTMARYVWALLTCALSLSPRAEMFYVRGGVEFRKEYMESILAKMTTREEKLMVGFTVMPGFKIGCTTIRCRVYLSMASTWGF